MEQARPLMGYVDQCVDQYRQRQELRQQGRIELRRLSTLRGRLARPQLKIYVSGNSRRTGLPRWQQPEWKDKEFDKSRNGSFVDTGWDKMLHEAYVTYAPGNFPSGGEADRGLGETDGFRLMDQINPVDSAGAGDVEFETRSSHSLIRADYHIQPNRAGSRTSDSRPSLTRMPGFRETDPSTWATMSRGSGLRT